MARRNPGLNVQTIQNLLDVEDDDDDDDDGLEPPDPDFDDGEQDDDIRVELVTFDEGGAEVDRIQLQPSPAPRSVPSVLASTGISNVISVRFLIIQIQVFIAESRQRIPASTAVF